MPPLTQAQGKPEAFTPYSAFAAEERTKLEIIDAYKLVLQGYAEDVRNGATEKTSQYLFNWYAWVHGFEKKAAQSEKLKNLQKQFKEGKIYQYKLEELSELVLAASDYMVQLKITDVLRRSTPDKYYLIEKIGERT